MEAEILGPTGNVHYRRPHTDKLIREALGTLSYSVRVPGGGLNLLPEMGLEESKFYPVAVNADGLHVKAWRGTCGCCNKNQARDLICEECIEKHME